ncbi:hypothetical protein V1264_010027 [Littorina saxatilis]|uniref:Uncharacterized protein n=1 Tax=Littorina saxatilis TaxID=31220 RepID=A0AAN9ANP8_9CAEN
MLPRSRQAQMMTSKFEMEAYQCILVLVWVAVVQVHALYKHNTLTDKNTAREEQVKVIMKVHHGTLVVKHADNFFTTPCRIKVCLVKSVFLHKTMKCTCGNSRCNPHHLHV